MPYYFQVGIPQVIFAKFAMEKELHEQMDMQSDNDAVMDPEHQKIHLLSKNTQTFRSMLYLSMKLHGIRLLLFILVIVFQEKLIINEKDKEYSDSWNVIFYVMACMMDFLGALNDATMIKVLNKDEQILEKVKAQLANKSEIVTQTKIGPYTSYLSLYEILKKYKFQEVHSVSISQTVRFLHITITFYIFGNLALNSQGRIEGQIFPVVFFWIFALSIYFNVFEMDLCAVQSSDGPFMEKDRSKCQVKNKQKDSEIQLSIKERYIEICRSPFFKMSVFNIVCMIGLVIFFFSVNLFTLMLILCICSHVIELMHQKWLQGKLKRLNFDKIPYKYLDPFKILKELTKNCKKQYIFIRILTRITIVMTIFAYFRDQELPSLQSFLFLLLNCMLFTGQYLKFKKLEDAQFYTIKIFQEGDFSRLECAICLQTFVVNEKVAQLPCFADHVYHKKCMRSWLAERKECPLCRFPLEKYDIQ